MPLTEHLIDNYNLTECRDMDLTRNIRIYYSINYMSISPKFLIKYDGQMVSSYFIEKKKDTEIKLNFYDFLDGNQLTTENQCNFYKKLKYC